MTEWSLKTNLSYSPWGPTEPTEFWLYFLLIINVFFKFCYKSHLGIWDKTPNIIREEKKSLMTPHTSVAPSSLTLFANNTFPKKNDPEQCSLAMVLNLVWMAEDTSVDAVSLEGSKLA